MMLTFGCCYIYFLYLLNYLLPYSSFIVVCVIHSYLLTYNHISPWKITNATFPTFLLDLFFNLFYEIFSQKYLHIKVNNSDYERFVLLSRKCYIGHWLKYTLSQFLQSGHFCNSIFILGKNPICTKISNVKLLD